MVFLLQALLFMHGLHGSPRLSELTSASWMMHWTRQKCQSLESGPRTSKNGFLPWRSFRFSWSLPGLFGSACSLDALYLSALSLPGNVFLYIVDPGNRLTSSSVLRVDLPGRKPSSPAHLSMPLGSRPSFHTCVFHAASLIL